MKALEIFLRLLDKFIQAFQSKKAQREQDALEKNPADWFSEHFSGGVHDKPSSKTSKTNSED